MQHFLNWPASSRVVSTLTEISGCFQPGQAKVGPGPTPLCVLPPPLVRSIERSLEEVNPISLVFQNIDPPSPSPPGKCVPRLCCGGRTDSLGREGDGGSIFWKTREIGLPSYHDLSAVRREDTLARGRGGWGVNILEDARHSSVLYICKYFVVYEWSICQWIWTCWRNTDKYVCLLLFCIYKCGKTTIACYYSHSIKRIYHDKAGRWKISLLFTRKTHYQYFSHGKYAYLDNIPLCFFFYSIITH
jgi:hypothetical protein